VINLTRGNKQNKGIKIKNSSVGNKKISIKWVITSVIWTFFISSIMQMISVGFISRVTLFIACLLLFSFILIGIIFDIIGVAVTAASEIPFHSLASRRIRGAKESIRLIRNADKVGNFCNDVIGDIASVIAGSATAAIVVMLNAFSQHNYEYILNIAMAGFVSALMVGGKAIGKGIAISYSNKIIFTVGKLISWFNFSHNRDKKK